MSIKQSLLHNFSKYTMIGVVFYFLFVGLNGLLIDVLHFPTFMTSLLVFLVLFLVKFFASVYLGVIKSRFALYVASNTLISLAAPFGVWLAVEQWHLPASLSTAVILAGVFVVRYVVMGRVGLLNVKH